jgi:ankyrin repeat protein
MKITIRFSATWLLLVYIGCVNGMEYEEEENLSSETILAWLEDALHSPSAFESLTFFYDRFRGQAIDRFISGDSKETALLHVLKKGRERGKKKSPHIVPLIKVLLGHGVDPNAVDLEDQDMIPLHMAVESGLLEIIDLLLQAGADPDKQDTQGNTALHTILLFNTKIKWTNKLNSIVKLILLAGPDIALRNNEGTSVKKLLKDEFGQNDDNTGSKKSDRKQFDQFLLAIILNDKQAVKDRCCAMDVHKLFAKINQLDRFGLTVLHYAVALGYHEIAHLLLSSGSNWLIKSNQNDIYLRLIIGRIIQYNINLADKEKNYYNNLLNSLYRKLAYIINALTAALIIRDDKTRTYKVLFGLPKDLMPTIFQLSNNEWGIIEPLLNTEKFKNVRNKFKKYAQSQHNMPLPSASLVPHPNRELHSQQTKALQEFSQHTQDAIQNKINEHGPESNEKKEIQQLAEGINQKEKKKKNIRSVIARILPFLATTK